MGWSKKRILLYPLQKWLADNDVSIHSTYNEGKSMVAETFIRPLKNKIKNER